MNTLGTEPLNLFLLAVVAKNMNGIELDLSHVDEELWPELRISGKDRHRELD